MAKLVTSAVSTFTGNGNGTAIDTSEWGSPGGYRFHLQSYVVSGTFTADVRLEVSNNGTDWVLYQTKTAPTAGYFTAPYKWLRAAVANYAAGTVKVTFAGFVEVPRQEFVTVAFANLTGNGQTAEVDCTDMAGTKTITVHGTFAGTAVPEGTIDGTNWFTLGAAFTIPSKLEIWFPKPLKRARLRCTAYTSGTISAEIAYVRYGARPPGFQGASLGSFVGTGYGTPVYVGACEDEWCTYLAGTFTGNVIIQGTFDSDPTTAKWATVGAALGYSAAGAAASGTGRGYRYLRAYCNSYAAGTIEVGFGGLDRKG